MERIQKFASSFVIFRVPRHFHVVSANPRITRFNLNFPLKVVSQTPSSAKKVEACYVSPFTRARNPDIESSNANHYRIKLGFFSKNFSRARRVTSSHVLCVVRLWGPFFESNIRFFYFLSFFLINTLLENCRGWHFENMLRVNIAYYFKHV